MADYWFKRNAWRYGVAPISWKGWAAVVGHAAVLLALSLSLAGCPPTFRWEPGGGRSRPGCL